MGSSVVNFQHIGSKRCNKGLGFPVRVSGFCNHLVRVVGLHLSPLGFRGLRFVTVQVTQEFRGFELRVWVPRK